MIGVHLLSKNALFGINLSSCRARDKGNVQASALGSAKCHKSWARGLDIN